MTGPGLEADLRREMCRAGRAMCVQAFVVACEGNLSARLGRDLILVTPAGARKGRLKPENLIVTDMTGAVVRGSGQPSSEIGMHLLYYHERPEVQAVCRAHPPTATGFAASGRALDQAVLPEVVLGLGTIPLAPYGTPGTWELCAGLESLVKKHDAILLENHGVVTCGQTVDIAYQRMEIVEQFARVLLTAMSLGGPRLLSQNEVRRLVATRSGHLLSHLEKTPELAFSRGSLKSTARQTEKDLGPLLEKAAG